ncbi:MAG: hypothetical protein IJG46_02150 [Prevotella sp.]|nr:hypothetical protein [Prevotella sp.]
MRRNPTTKRDSKNSVRRASENAPQQLMSYVEDVHHTRGLVILFVQKYKENKEIPKDFWKKMSDGTVMADGIDHHF